MKHYLKEWLCVKEDRSVKGWMNEVDIEESNTTVGV